MMCSDFLAFVVHWGGFGFLVLGIWFVFLSLGEGAEVEMADLKKKLGETNNTGVTPSRKREKIFMVLGAVLLVLGVLAGNYQKSLEVYQAQHCSIEATQTNEENGTNKVKRDKAKDIYVIGDNNVIIY